MDILDILSNDERIIVLTSKEDRSFYTWNKSDTLQWWRPKVRVVSYDNSYSFDPNDWMEVGILTLSGHGPKTYEEARKVAEGWDFGNYDLGAGDLP